MDKLLLRFPTSLVDKLWQDFYDNLDKDTTVPSDDYFKKHPNETVYPKYTHRDPKISSKRTKQFAYHEAVPLDALPPNATVYLEYYKERFPARVKRLLEPNMLSPRGVNVKLSQLWNQNFGISIFNRTIVTRAFSTWAVFLSALVRTNQRAAKLLWQELGIPKGIQRDFFAMSVRREDKIERMIPLAIAKDYLTGYPIHSYGVFTARLRQMGLHGLYSYTFNNNYKRFVKSIEVYKQYDQDKKRRWMRPYLFHFIPVWDVLVLWLLRRYFYHFFTKTYNLKKVRSCFLGAGFNWLVINPFDFARLIMKNNYIQETSIREIWGARLYQGHIKKILEHSQIPVYWLGSSLFMREDIYDKKFAPLVILVRAKALQK